MVAQGSIDAFIFDCNQLQLAIDSGLRGVHLLDDTLEESVHIAVGISQKSRIPDLQGKLNAFIAEIKANGILNDMYERWVVRREDTMPEIDPPPEIHYKLTVGTQGLVPPYSYYAGTELTGHDFYDGNSQLADYCVRHHMPDKLRYKVLLVFEELVKEILYPGMQNPAILFTVEYNPVQHDVVIDVQYNGPALDLAADESDLSRRMLLAASVKMTQDEKASDGYSSRIRIVLS